MPAKKNGKPGLENNACQCGSEREGETIRSVTRYATADIIEGNLRALANERGVINRVINSRLVSAPKAH